MTRKEKRALRRFWQLENIVLYEDFDDDTLDYIWSTQSIVEAIERYRKLKRP